MNEREEILRKTNKGLDIFTHFFGEMKDKRNFCNKYRKDAMPSCHLYVRKDAKGYERYYMKDYGASEWSGDCFSIAAKILGFGAHSDFADILRAIDDEMALGIFTLSPIKGQYKHEPLPQTDTTPAANMNSPVGFRAIYSDFSRSDVNFWGSYGIDQYTLSRYNVKKISNIQYIREDMSRYVIHSKESDPVYGYVFKGGRGIKTYRPTGAVRFMYAGDYPKPYVFGMQQLAPQGSRLYVTGGEKDVLSLAAHGFNAICLNSESAKMPEELFADISTRFQTIAFLYDSDDRGKIESKKRIEELGGGDNVIRVELPLPGTKREKDVSDFFLLKGAEGVDELLELTQKAEEKTRGN